jgi:hypothetical protein
MTTKLIVIVAVVLACGCAFWIASTGRVGVQVAALVEKLTAAASNKHMPGKLPGVPANTIAQAAKAARALRKASIAYDIGIVVQRNHAEAVALKARADRIDELIDEIERQPVTGKPADAEKKIPSLRALRDFAKLDDPSALRDIEKLDESQ